MQTALGSAKLAGASDDKLSQLRNNVTSPGGTTEQAVLLLNNPGFAASLMMRFWQRETIY